MRRLAFRHRFFQRVGEFGFTISYWLKFIALLLAFPSFELCNFFFERTLLLKKRELIGLSGKNLTLKVYDRRIDSRRIAHTLYSPCDIHRVLKGC